MREAIVYVAADGSEFKSAKACEKYEALLKEVKVLMKPLPKLPKDNSCEFANGKGWIQHTEDTYRKVWTAFYKLACREHDGIEEYAINSYGFARTLDDGGSPLYAYYMRYVNTNPETLREYGQMYYRLHPEEVTGKQLN